MENKITTREWLPLIGMTVSAFIFNTSEFMPIGLLSDIAADFRMTEAQAGMLITIYAYVVMLMSLPLMIAASRYPLRKLLLATIQPVRRIARSLRLCHRLLDAAAFAYRRRLRPLYFLVGRLAYRRASGQRSL